MGVGNRDLTAGQTAKVRVVLCKGTRNKNKDEDYCFILILVVGDKSTLFQKPTFSRINPEMMVATRAEP